MARIRCLNFPQPGTPCLIRHHEEGGARRVWILPAVERGWRHMKTTLKLRLVSTGLKNGSRLGQS